MHQYKNKMICLKKMEKIWFLSLYIKKNGQYLPMKIHLNLYRLYIIFLYSFWFCSRG